MSTKLISRNDSQFDQMQKQYITTVSGTPDKFGLLAGDVTGLKTAQTTWGTAYSTHIKAQQDAQAATQAKEVARGSLEELVRLAARKLNGHPGVDNGIRSLVGLPPRDHVRTAIGSPSTRPLWRLESTGPLTLLVHFRDELTPSRTAKPKGVRGCEIWVHIGDPAPQSPAEYRFLALATRTPYTSKHEAADAGKTAYYLLRWQNPRGESGPFGVMVAAKIPL